MKLVAWRKLILFGVLWFTCTDLRADDYEVMYQRLYEDYISASPLADPVIQGFMVSLQADGSWPDINYDTHVFVGGWEPVRHWDRLFNMALAYNRAERAGHKQARLKEKIKTAILYWYNRHPQPYSDNWYDNDIALPERIYKVLILMHNAYTGSDWEQIVQQGCQRYLVLPDNYEQAEYKSTHTNACWIARGLVHHGVLRKDLRVLQCGIDIMAEQIGVQPLNSVGLQSDYSYLVHGLQLYNAGYGTALIETVSYYMHLTRGLSIVGFGTDSRKTLGDMLLQGDQWMVHGGMYDFSTAGRNIARKGIRGLSSAKLKKILRRMEYVDSSRREDYQKMLAHLHTPDGSLPGLIGNKHFWRADYMAHRREGLFFGIKMSSRRTIGTEGMNGENRQGFWLPFGATAMMRHAQEYNDIFGLWDWTKIPGVTNPAKQIIWPERAATFVSNTTAFVGGVSDGTHGVAGFRLAVDTVVSSDTVNVSGEKAYFLFGNELICLGAGISSTMASVPITTTLNQSFLRSEVLVDDVAVVREDEQLYDSVRWIHHDQTGYVFRKPTTVSMKNNTQSGSWHDIHRGLADTPVEGDIFKCWLDHGYTPRASTYEYAVLPNLTAQETGRYAQELPYTTLANTDDVQAVRHDALQVCGIVFYAASTVDIGHFSVTVDKPCMLLVDFSEPRLWVTAADPKQSQSQIEVSLSYPKAPVELLRFDMPEEKEAGKSVTLQAKTAWKPKESDK